MERRAVKAAWHAPPAGNMSQQNGVQDARVNIQVYAKVTIDGNKRKNVYKFLYLLNK